MYACLITQVGTRGQLSLTFHSPVVALSPTSNLCQVSASKSIIIILGNDRDRDEVSKISSVYRDLTLLRKKQTCYFFYFNDNLAGANASKPEQCDAMPSMN
jgi:hypothetical protein